MQNYYNQQGNYPSNISNPHAPLWYGNNTDENDPANQIQEYNVKK